MAVHGTRLQELGIAGKQVMTWGKRTIRAVTGRLGGSGSVPGAAYVSTEVLRPSAACPVLTTALQEPR